MRSGRFVLTLALSVFGISGPTVHAATEDDKITADDAAAFDRFGNWVAVSGATVVVGTPFDDDAGSQSGSAYVFDCGSLPCVQVSKLTASDAVTLDQFGHSVAVSGTSVLIGAPLDDAAGGDTGSAYYFDLSTCGAACNETSKLTASDPGLTDLFGASVAVSETTAVVGATLDDDAGSQSGSAYYFDLSTCGATCNENGKLTASDAAAFDRFGTSVGVHGTTGVVGAPGVTDVANSGSAYYFDLSTCGAACNETGKLTASDAAAFDQFGISLGVSGVTVVVGATADLDDASGVASGSAYHFDLSACGTACNETAKLTVSDATTIRQFGFSLGVSGMSVVVSAAVDLNHDPGVTSGAVYYFDLSACGATCTETDRLSASDATASDQDEFGWSVAVSERIAVVGARFDDDAGPRSGSAYIFELADPDDDGDGVPNGQDVCPGGDDNVDTDFDTVPDFCDLCPLDDQNDADGDGVCGDVDACPGFDDNVNADGDDLPDACDVCPFDAVNDADADGLCADEDNCPGEYNPNQADNDGDTAGDECDPDDDNDGVDDGEDNCPFDPNPGQDDADGDGDGDACDQDDDGDGVGDADDSCPGTDPGDVVSGNGCSIAQLCPCESSWKNHGAYVRCVAQTAEVFVGLGLITEAEKDAIVSGAAQSSCGHRN